MFSIRFMLGLAAGAAGGYALSRVMEARAMGVPLDMAFGSANILVPVHKLSIRQQEESARLLRISRGTEPQPTGPKTTKPLMLAEAHEDDY